MPEFIPPSLSRDFLLHEDAGDEDNPLDRIHYGYRQDDKVDEIERLTKERDEAIREYEACHEIMEKVRQTIADCLGAEILHGLTVEAPRKAVKEIEHLRAQLDAARTAYRKLKTVYNPRAESEYDALLELGDELGEREP